MKNKQFYKEIYQNQIESFKKIESSVKDSHPLDRQCDYKRRCKWGKKF